MKLHLSLEVKILKNEENNVSGVCLKQTALNIYFIKWKKTYALIFWTLSTSGGNNTCDVFGAGGIFSRPLGLLGSSLYSSAKFCHKISVTFKTTFSRNTFVWNICTKLIFPDFLLVSRTRKKKIWILWTMTSCEISRKYLKLKYYWGYIDSEKGTFFQFPENVVHHYSCSSFLGLLKNSFLNDK